MPPTTLYTAKWFRAAVRLEGDRIIPDPPFLSYDPFDFYVPAKDAARKDPRNRSLHFQFLAVKADDPREVLQFCERFGVLGKWVWPDVERAYGAHIRKQKAAITEVHETMKSGARAFNDAMIQIARNEVEPDPISYSEPMGLETFRNAQAHLKTFMAQACAVQGGGLPNRQDIASVLSGNFATQMLGVRPVLTWDVQADRWTFRWAAFSLQATLWLMLLLDLLGPGQIIFCARCNAPFLGTRPRDRFCSQQCGDVFKVTKWRKKHQVAKSDLPKATAKGGSRHGTKKR